MLRPSVWILLAGLTLGTGGLSLAGCGDAVEPGDGGARRDGSANNDGGTGLDGSADGAQASDSATDTGAPPGDGSCGGASFAVRPIPPNVLILLDRSCSMRRTPDGVLLPMSGTGTSKWEIAVTALRDLTTAYDARVRFGMIYLPRSGSVAEGAACGATPVCGGTTTCPEIAPGPHNGGLVTTLLGAISPFDGCDTGAQQHITPLNDALIAAGRVAELHDATRSDVVLLVTDGQESCLTNNSTMDAATLAAQVRSLAMMNIKTAVVGFGATGGTDGVDPVELEAMAAAGGLPASGTMRYYAAMDSASLHSAFETIIASTLSCSFTLTTPASDASRLHVYVNGAPPELPRDPAHASGWDYDDASHTVTLYGASCDDVHHGRLTQLDVLQGCPGQPPPPPPGMCHVMGQSCTTDSDCCGVRGFVCDTAAHACTQAPG